jgi:aquaporin Z
MRHHLPEYAIEGAGLGLFMLIASLCATVLEHPASPVRAAVPDPVARRALMGLAMGSTVIALVYSPWGRRSGAHLNPALTLTFWRLGKVRGSDVAGYVAAQLVGGVAGTLLAAAVIGAALAAPEVNYIATVPGAAGRAGALAGEVAIGFTQMTAVLWLSNTPRLAPRTGLVAGVLVAIYIVVEAPLSGMSLNPARSLGPAALAHTFDTFWIYLAGPLTGMLLAAEAFVRTRGLAAVLCAKLHHGGGAPCPFNCGFHGQMP